MVAGSDPLEQAIRISLKKAQIVASRHPAAVVIAADTFGILDGRFLGKPASRDDAVRMLVAMSGQCHTVITGFTVIDTGTGRTVSRAISTRVCFRELSLSEINAYVNSGEPLDKAGAYAIQGLGAVFVDRIEGDYFNVIGLPLAALTVILKEFHISVLA